MRPVCRPRISTPLRRIGLLAREREDAVVEAEQRHLILRRHVAEELLHGFFQLRHRRRHAAGDVDCGDELQRDVLGGEVRDRLRVAVLEQVECRLRDVRHEAAAAVAHGDGDLHDVHVDALGVADRFRAHRLHDASAAFERGDGAHLMLGDRGAGVPVALEGNFRERAGLSAVDEEGESGNGLHRIDLRAQQRRAADVRFVARREDRQLRSLRRRGLDVLRRRLHADRRGRRHGEPGDRSGEEQAASDHLRIASPDSVSGTSGPPAVAAAT